MTNPSPLRAVPGRRSRAAAAALVAIVCAVSAAPARAREKASSPLQRSAALFLQACSKCHTIGGGPLVGPDLRGVTERHDEKWIEAFVLNPDSHLDSDPVAKKLLAENDGVRMENTHVTREQVQGLILLIKTASNSPVNEIASEQARLAEEPLLNKLRMPDEGTRGYSIPALVLAAVLVLAALVVSRFARRRETAVLFVLAAASAYWGLGGWRHHLLPGEQQGYEPVQPLAFSHELHAGKLTISCLYCHGGAERSDTAGVPPAGLCMNCHVAVRARAGATEPSQDIAKIVAAWETRTSSAPATLAWARVHHLPDYVHFSHRAHIANNIQCQECHGPVQTMARLRQAAPLTMGWCIKCHRTTPQAAPSHWKRVGGPIDCSACHW
jgi:mono/diheme cytochrome c family protein